MRSSSFRGFSLACTTKAPFVGAVFQSSPQLPRWSHSVRKHTTEIQCGQSGCVPTSSFASCLCLFAREREEILLLSESASKYLEIPINCCCLRRVKCLVSSCFQQSTEHCCHMMLTGHSRPPVVPQLHPGVGQPHPGLHAYCCQCKLPSRFLTEIKINGHFPKEFRTKIMDGWVGRCGEGRAAGYSCFQQLTRRVYNNCERLY